MQVADAHVTRQAAGIIAKQGLTKENLLRDADGRVCVNGAVIMAITGVSRPAWEYLYLDLDGFLGYQQFLRVQRALRKQLSAMGCFAEPSEFSNDPDVSQEDVILLLKHAAEALDADS